MVIRLLLPLLLATSVRGAELEGVNLEERIHVDGQPLQLNGMAMRTWMIFKIYVAGLYLPQKVSNARSAIEGGGAKRIVLVMMRDATADQFCEFVESGLGANNSETDIKRVRPQVEALYAKIRNVGEARKGMRIVLDFAPSSAGTTLFVDGAAQGAPMAGTDFFRALLRIWLGENPAQPGLKRMLLGQSENERE